MKTTLEQLVGIQEEKPFECVGSRAEINTAIVMTIDRTGKTFRCSFPIIKGPACMTGIRRRETSIPPIMTGKTWCLNPGSAW